MKKLFSVIVILLIIILFIPKKVYKATDFNITIIKSNTDYDKDLIDDYTDIMQGARIDALNKVKYKSAYYKGGYPPNNEGVCADLIWRSFKNAGYLLKDLIDEDIKKNAKLYFKDDEKPDSNIDFRRVRNLKVFFDRFATVLTNDTKKIAEWMPGDIVIFGKKYNHIGIISDKRNKKGIPYLIHNAGQYKREEDVLLKWNRKKTITGHYRWEK
ncbi:MAG: DUF1287 domain-containing protein [Bacilli bacterium]